MAARIQGHKNPFGKPLLEYNLAQLDFVLEMEALDNPREFVFSRNGVSTDNAHVSETRAAWFSVLRGRDRLKYVAGLPFKMVADYHARHAGGMKAGVRRKGKAK